MPSRPQDALSAGRGSPTLRPPPPRGVGVRGAASEGPRVLEHRPCTRRLPRAASRPLLCLPGEVAGSTPGAGTV